MTRIAISGIMVAAPRQALPHSMRKLALASIAAATLCLRLPVHAQDLVLDRFGDYLDSLRAQVGIPGLTAAIVGANDITWERPFGYSNVERLVATRTDTLYHVDGLTQTLTATLVLRCVEGGRLSLDGRAGDATIRQLLTHTTGAADAPQFLYRPDRLAPLAEAVSTCTGESFRTSMAGLLDQLNMIDAVPGPDASPQAYASKLDRLATPYAVNAQRRPSPSRYAATTLTAAAGLIATTRDLAKFDVELKRRRLLRPETIALALQLLRRVLRHLAQGFIVLEVLGGGPVEIDLEQIGQRLVQLVADAARQRPEVTSRRGGGSPAQLCAVNVRSSRLRYGILAT